MDEERAHEIWDEYHTKIRNRRLSEAHVMNTQLESEGITSENKLFLDFTVFSNDEEGVANLEKQLSENYDMSVKKDDDAYWLIRGTTRPYTVNLGPSKHIEWVELMHDVALSHRAIFSTWVITEPIFDKS